MEGGGSSRKGKHLQRHDEHPEPWLIYNRRGRNNEQTFYCFSEGHHHVRSIPELRNKSVLSSSHGWLLLLDEAERDCLLLNPVTMEKIQLPQLPSTRCTELRCTVSSPADSSSCIVMFIEGKPGNKSLHFCKPKDEDWKKQEVEVRCDCRIHHPDYERYPYFHTITSLNGEFYVLTSCCQALFKVEFNQGDDDKHHVISSSHGGYFRLIDLNSRKPVAESYFINGSAGYSWYLIQYSPSELMIVEVKNLEDASEANYHLDHGCNGIELYKTDFQDEQWQTMESLPEDCAIFSGRYQANILLYNIPREVLDSGLVRGNTIYFTQMKEYVYAYDVQERSISVSSPCPNVEPDSSYPVWILSFGWSSTVDSQAQVATSEYGSRSQGRAILSGEREIVSKQITLSGSSVEYGWSNVPIGLLTDIQSRLLGADRCCFRLACKTWKLSFSTSTHEFDNQRAKQITHQFPILVHIGQDGEMVNVFSPMTNSSSNLSLPDANLKGSVIRCSRHGWLLMSSGMWGRQVFFFNPFNKQRIDLPELLVYFFEGITFTTSPTSSDCIVFGYWISQGDVKFASICRGEDIWTYSEVDRTGVRFDHSYSNPVYHQGLFYFMGNTGNLCTADPAKRDTEPETKLTNLPSKPCDSIQRSHLLECNGKLLSVFTGHMGRFMKAYELNQGTMAWKEVENLEDTMLFLGYASSLSATTNGVGISGLGNKVLLERFSGKNSVFYSLATKRFHTFWSGYNSDNWCETKAYTNCAWIEPNFVKHEGEELLWFDPAV